MSSWLKAIGAILLMLVITATLTFYQPWAEYSPADMNRTFLADERVENFRNMDKLYPSQLIRKAGKTHQWPNQSKPLEFSYQFDGKTIALSDNLERTNTTGLIVIKDGVIIHEQYRLGETKDSLHTSWSVAKSFVSTMVGMAIDDGLIASVDDQVQKYIPELSDKAYGQATIKDVLQMSSGVDFFESYGAAGSNTALAFSDVQKVSYASWLFGQNINKLVGAYGKKEEPGTRWEYRSGDTQILGWLVEKVMQKPFAQIIEQRIWQPMGMESDANWIVDGSDERSAITFGFLNATLRDFARLGELYRLGGTWDGQQLLSKEWILEATTPDRDHVQPENVRGYRGYQYQWWVPKDYDREYFASGIWSQHIWVDEKRGVVIARTAVDPNFTANMNENVEMLRAISSHVAK
jgi:CubicO group peptidase (beta-lactamase class C family)